MKKILLLASLALTMGFISCEKTSVSPATNPATTTNQTFTVEYKIQATSGNFQFEYNGLSPENKPAVITGTSAKMSQSFFLTMNKAEMLNVKAKNTNPSANEVSVEIYVNGVLKSYGLANAAGKWATAEAIAE